MKIIKKSFSIDYFFCEFLVDEFEHNVRLDEVFKNHLTQLSRQNIKRKIAKGEICIINRRDFLPFPHRASTLVKQGDHITLYTYAKNQSEFLDEEEAKYEVAAEDLQILYDDTDILAINKPPFMSTHPSGAHLFYCATVLLESRYQKKFHSLHRLDRETSGVLLLGKSSQSAEMYGDLFENRQMDKCYFFISKLNQTMEKKFLEKFSDQTEECFFWATESLGYVELTQQSKMNNLQIQAYEDQHLSTIPKNRREELSIKPAQTLFYFLKVSDFLIQNTNHLTSTFLPTYPFLLNKEGTKYLLGLAFPQTGRQHQIRAHAHHHNFSLLGDKIYNPDGENLFIRHKDLNYTQADRDYCEITRHALHALFLKWKIPSEKNQFNQKDIQIKAPLPLDLLSWLQNSFPDFSLERLEKILGEKIHWLFESLLKDSKTPRTPQKFE